MSMRMADKMKAMSPEEKVAWKKKMADARAAKKKAAASPATPAVATVTVEKNKSKPKPAVKAKPRIPSGGDLENSGSGGDDDGWLL